MTNLEKLIETLQNAPIEKTACFISYNFDYSCRWCAYYKDGECTKIKEDYNDKYSDVSYYTCEQGIKKWLESEVE